MTLSPFLLHQLSSPGTAGSQPPASGWMEEGRPGDRRKHGQELLQRGRAHGRLVQKQLLNEEEVRLARLYETYTGSAEKEQG